jgi:hypothetical protein
MIFYTILKITAVLETSTRKTVLKLISYHYVSLKSHNLRTTSNKSHKSMPQNNITTFVPA